MGIIKPIDPEVFSQLKKIFSTQFDGEVTRLKDALNQKNKAKIRNNSGDLISAKTLDEIFKGKKDSTNEKNLNYLCELLLECSSYVEAIEILKKVPRSNSGSTVSDHKEINLDVQQCLIKYGEKTKQRCDSIKTLDNHQALSTIEIYTKAQFYNLEDLRRNDYQDIVQDFVDKNSEISQEVSIDSLEEVINATRLLVLGRPGAGKTTFLKYLSLRYINTDENHAINDFGYVVHPIYLPLHLVSKYIDNQGLLEWVIHDISEGSENIEAVRHNLLDMFYEGRFILFLDALDETSELFDETCEKIREFLYLYPKNRIIITSRLSTHYPIFEGFKSVEIAAFNEEQIDQFARNWFRQDLKYIEDDDISSDELVSNFLDKLKSTPYAYRLANNPLTLTYLCMLYKGNYGFAKCEAEIFKDVADIFLRRWDEARNIRNRIPQFKDKLTKHRKFMMFAFLAYEGITQSPAKYTWKQNEIENWLYKFLLKISTLQTNDSESSIREDAKNLLNVAVMDDGLLIPVSRDYYAFPYISMQEYFVAEYMSRNSFLVNDVISKNFLTPNWRNVFIMLIELIPDSEDLFRLMFFQIQKILEKYPKIEGFLVWLNDVSVDFKTETSSWRSQIILLNTVIDLYISRQTPIRDIFALQLSKNLKIYNQRRKKAHDNQPKLIISLYLAITHALVEDQLFQNQDGHKSLRKTNPMILDVLVVDETTTIESQFEKAITESQEYYSDTQLSQLLISLKNILPLDKNKKSLTKWGDKLKQAMIENLNVGYAIKLNEEELEALDSYLYGNSLLLQCIMGYNISSVYLRDLIVDSMLLPPKLIPDDLKMV